MWDRFHQLMSRPVSGASLGIFRLTFGTVIFYEGLYYLGFTWNNPTSTNYIDTFYTGKHILWNVPYPGFSWIKPLPEPLMTGLFVVLTIAGLLVALGVLYRLAIIGVFLCFSYINLMDAWTYLNHHYLACMIAMMLAFMPADRRFSLRRQFARLTGRKGRTVRREIPFWNLFLLRGQMFIVYFYAGVAKINPDWLAGEPIRMWFRQPDTMRYLEPYVSSPVLQAIRTFLAEEYTIWAIVYGGMIFDLAIGFLLVFRRTRLMGFLLFLGFHTFNYFQFKIGAFPVMAVCLTMIFFDPDWPDRARRWFSKPTFSKPNWRWLVGGVLVLPPVGAVLGWKFSPTPLSADRRRMRLAPWTAALVLTWLGIQTVVPLRHFFIPGNSSWTEEGSMLSWHMMLRTKQLGVCQIEIVDSALPMTESDVGRYADWRVPDDHDPLVPYRQVTSGNVPWKELPEFVIVCEPLVGERIIYNPLSKEAPGGDPVKHIHRRWRSIYGYEPKRIGKTYSVGRLLDVHEAYVRQRTGRVERSHVIAQLRAIEFARQIDQHRRDLQYCKLRRLECGRKLYEAFNALSINPSFRDHFRTILFRSAPLDGLGDGRPETPFFVVGAPELLERGRGMLPVVRRDVWQGSISTLIDLWTYPHGHLRNLSRCLSFHDLDGRPALLWNYAHELHRYQATFVTVMPPFLHRYVQHVASEWEATQGRRPRIYVKNYVKLNCHPMQLIVDPEIDLASTPLTVFRHNAWILPLEPPVEAVAVSHVAPTP